QFQQAYVLDGFGFDRLDSCDVEEVILVVVHEIAFHLRWRHAPVWLCYVNHRQIQVRENIDRHAHKGENRAQGHTDHENDHGDRIPQCAAQEPHVYRAPCGSVRSAWRNGARSPCAAATEARFCQTASRASASSISACTRKLCASDTSTSVASPA